MSTKIADSIYELPAFDLPVDHKSIYFFSEINRLDELHKEKCKEYALIRDNLVEHLGWEYPAIPVRLFKSLELLSVDRSSIVKTMMSSGTSGQQSKIFLDHETSKNQVRVLSKIVQSFIGPKRLPMLIIDSEEVIRNRYSFSARTAGVLGFSMYGRDITFALTEDLSLNWEAIDAFLEKYSSQEVLIFGFTYLVWSKFIAELDKTKKAIDLKNAFLIHGGGWKKIEDQAVSKQFFRCKVEELTGVTNVHNYYGMVEQTGSIFMECNYGHLHSSAWSDVIIRDPISLQIAADGAEGLVQLLSVIPKSYPGHSILSEDIGRILGRDGCPCGRRGTFFAIDGRLKKAELRGCSDSYNN